MERFLQLAGLIWCNQAVKNPLKVFLDRRPLWMDATLVGWSGFVASLNLNATQIEMNSKKDNMTEECCGL